MIMSPQAVLNICAHDSSEITFHVYIIVLCIYTAFEM